MNDFYIAKNFTHSFTKEAQRFLDQKFSYYMQEHCHCQNFLMHKEGLVEVETGQMQSCQITRPVWSMQKKYPSHFEISTLQISYRLHGSLCAYTPCLPLVFIVHHKQRFHFYIFQHYLITLIVSTLSSCKGLKKLKETFGTLKQLSRVPVLCGLPNNINAENLI